MDGLFGRMSYCFSMQFRRSNLPLSNFSHRNTSRRLSSASTDRDKKQVVVLGTGWSSLYFVKYLDLSKYDLKVVSPRNYFTFTPFLPKLSTGNISRATCTEPFTEFLRRHKRGNFQFIHANCLDVDPKERNIFCGSATNPNRSFTLPYDYLVVAVGAETNTFGIAGVEEHALFLKEIEHAERIYQNLISNLEEASLPSIDEEEKRRLLHIVVVGGGPTGVELTGEMATFFNAQVAKTFPSLLPYVKVTVVDGGERLLSTFTPSNSSFTHQVLTKNNVNIMLGHQVCAVGKDECTIKKVATGEINTLKCGMVVWASGLKPSRLLGNIKKHFKEQNNPRALVVDQHLALRGNADRNIFVLGDCGIVEPDKLADRFDEVVKRLGSSTHQSLIRHRKALANEFPQLSNNKFNPKSEKFKSLCSKLSLEKHDSQTALMEVMKYIDSNYAPPVPTAQNAKQEGIYLSRMFNKGIWDNIPDAFNDLWRGSLASIGGKHVVGNFPLFQLNGGFKTFLMWLGVYMAMLSSHRMRFCYAIDSLARKLFGRHIISRQVHDNKPQG